MYQDKADNNHQWQQQSGESPVAVVNTLVIDRAGEIQCHSAPRFSRITQPVDENSSEWKD